MEKNQEKQKELIALFSRENDLDKIRNAFSDCIGLPRSEGGNVLMFGSQTCNIALQIVISSMGEDEKKFLREQKNAVCGLFAGVDAEDEDIKINLCHYIQQSTAFISILLEAKSEQGDLREDVDKIIGIVQEVMEDVDSVLVAEQGTVALNKDNEVILSEDGDSDLETYFPFTLEENPERLKDCTDRQKTRRYENMKYLFDREIYVMELPVNSDDEEISLRSKEETVRRMLGLLVVSLYSESMLNPAENMDVPQAREFIARVMDNYAIRDPKEILTPAELAYIQDDNPEEKTMINYSWNYEHLYTLEWVLGLMEWTEPTDICDVPLTVRSIDPNLFDSIETICEKTIMHSKKEILDKADLVYRMDWAAVDARCHRMTGPAGIDHGVIQARHKTLNWMIRFLDAEWDDVDTPT
ncbi:MAG: DUF4272 domain-containing protein [Lachnospiraceae bacterium]|nr:DUF4272 domain-containing protein [Lachnospiraceae bacterium]